MLAAVEEWRRWLANEASEAGRELFAPLIAHLESAGEESLAMDPMQRDPELIAALWPLLKATEYYLGAEVRGFENLPKNEPVLIVGNHSGGAFTLDPVPLMAKWIERRGVEAPLYALSYQLFFTYPGIGGFMRRVGCLPANPQIAQDALGKGASIVVFPGGDYEVFRPWRDRNRVDLGGRMGFIELALNAGVPVVPMTIHGAHESTLVLTRGHRIAHELGLDKLRIKVFPLVWNLPFGVAPAFLPSLPVPTKVTVQLGHPIDWSDLGAEACEDPEIMQHCYDEVVTRMQQAMDDLARERPYPVLSRLNDMRPSRMLRRFVGEITGARDA
jgi:1-acyl-sn-glycerol-3-phosphate acyltransferase